MNKGFQLGRVNGMRVWNRKGKDLPLFRGFFAVGCQCRIAKNTPYISNVSVSWRTVSSVDRDDRTPRRSRPLSFFYLFIDKLGTH